MSLNDYHRGGWLPLNDYYDEEKGCDGGWNKARNNINGGGGGAAGYEAGSETIYN